MTAQPIEFVTFKGAADVLNRYVQAYVRAMGRSADIDLQQRAFTILYPDNLDSRSARRLRKGSWCSPRQVQYMAAAIGQSAHEPKASGDARVIDAVEVAFLGLILVVRLLGYTGGARMWAGVAAVASPIREGLRVPSRKLGLKIDARGFVTVVPYAEAEADEDALVVDLAGVRAHVDRLIKREHQRQPLVWSQWRMRHVNEIRKELRAS